MIYLKSGQFHILILEPGNLVDMKAGEVIHSPNNEVAIFYTPDILKMRAKLFDIISPDGIVDPKEFDRIHKECLNNEERTLRPYHEKQDMLNKKKGIQ